MTPEELVMDIHFVRAHTGCSIADARLALDLRDGIAVFAVEYLKRVNLSALETRYPQWAEYKRNDEDDLSYQFGF